VTVESIETVAMSPEQYEAAVDALAVLIGSWMERRATDAAAEPPR
jgi:hypothetical protein